MLIWIWKELKFSYITDIESTNKKIPNSKLTTIGIWDFLFEILKILLYFFNC